jgi:hypothetical protein
MEFISTAGLETAGRRVPFEAGGIGPPFCAI